MEIKDLINPNNKINKFLFNTIIGSLLIFFVLGPAFDTSIKYIKQTDYYLNFFNIGKEEYSLAQKEIENNNYKQAQIYLEKYLKIILNNVEEEHKLVIDTYIKMANLYLKEGKYDEALNYEEKALRIKYLIFNENYETIAESHYSIANVLNAKGLYKEAVKTFEIAYELHKSHKYYNTIANSNFHLGYYQEALKYYNLSLKNNNPFDEISIYLSALVNEQLIYSNNSNIQETKRFLEEVIELFENNNHENNYNLFSFYNNLGGILEKEKEYKKALNLYTKALNLITNINLNKNHIAYAIIYNSIGLNYYYQMDYEKSIIYYNKAIHVLESINTEHYYISITNKNIAQVYTELNDYVNAEKYYKKSLELAINIFDRNNYIVSDIYLELGNLYFKIKKYDYALNIYKKALLVQENLDNNHNNIYKNEIYALIADIYQIQGNIEKSISYFENELKKFSENDKKEYNFICLELSTLYFSKKMPRKGKEYAEKLDKFFLEEELIKLQNGS